MKNKKLLLFLHVALAVVTLVEGIACTTAVFSYTTTIGSIPIDTEIMQYGIAQAVVGVCYILLEIAEVRWCRSLYLPLTLMLQFLPLMHLGAYTGYDLSIFHCVRFQVERWMMMIPALLIVFCVLLLVFDWFEEKPSP